MIESLKNEIHTVANMQYDNSYSRHFDTFGDSNLKHASKGGPIMGNSHIGSPLGFNRPKDKIEGTIFRDELSQSNMIQTLEVL